MSNDHVGIPKLIQKGFSKSGMVSSYSFSDWRYHKSSIERLGTEENYYETYIEKDLLANNVENEFGKFYDEFMRSLYDPEHLIRITTLNQKLIQEFISFMFMRAKKTLEVINKNSLSVKIFGTIDHSELLKIQSVIKTNPLLMISKDVYILPVINLTNINFINNSLGINIIVTKRGETMFLIPLSTKVGLWCCDKSFSGKSEIFFISKNECIEVDKLNSATIRFEHLYGNGFIFGQKKNDLQRYEKQIDNYKLKNG